MTPHEDLAAQLRCAGDWERASFYSCATAEGILKVCFLEWHIGMRIISEQLRSLDLLSPTYEAALVALYEWGADPQNWTPVDA